MRVLIQRVKEASVKVEEALVSEIASGLLIFHGIHKDDREENSLYLAKKIANLRLFPDENGKMNKSILEISGDVLVVSQFTLYGNCLNGRRPDFIDAAPPQKAESLYHNFIHHLEKEIGKKIFSGLFGANMQVSLINDGPVTFIIEK